ncbi:cupin domain-containing protein [Planosporangium flavigriseum]|uniref:MerR family transcriptional regulator n=1 Tax=Planosporangium flavigriseum TaxID=373681 RepID=A0A8J3LN16_9ACTN|nr:cupin domain-containing protein [Planosporangium flavigriseum]NJC65693.1 cupin domain-containing protein [Planosporangium flavigriseum]GIG73543.1 MerR family transcriptional regulator [Planosporangium flavigriseum]
MAHTGRTGAGAKQRDRVARPASGGPDDGEADKELGKRIRQLRTGKQVSLREAAEAASVSESFLSQVERGMANPSVASLRRIAEALGEPIASLFDGGPVSGMVVRVADRRRLAQPAGAWEDSLLTPPVARRIQLIESVVGAGRGSGDEPYTHAGDEECVVVLKGKIEISVGDDQYCLRAGDTLLLDPSLPHSFHNPTPRPATVMWVISPPLY